MARTQLFDPVVVHEDMHVSSLPEQAYHLIRRAIVSGHFGPGQWLRQRDLAQELGIGTSTVREALNRLATEGFLVAKPNRGFRTVIPTLQYMVDLGEVLLALEPRALELAASRISPEALAQLRDVLPQSRYSLGSDLALYYQADHDFHAIGWQACGREYLGQVLERTFAGYTIGQLIHLYSEKDQLALVELTGWWNPQVLEALAARDGKRAADVCRRAWQCDLGIVSGFYQRIQGQI